MSLFYIMHVRSVRNGRYAFDEGQGPKFEQDRKIIIVFIFYSLRNFHLIISIIN